MNITYLSFLVLPVILPVVPALASLAIFLLGRHIWVKHLKRQSFCILGERASGKTVLHHFLSHGEIFVGKYEQSIKNKTKKNTLRLKDCKFRVAESEDIGGSETFRNQWKELIQNSDHVCYIVRGDKIYNDDGSYSSKILDHINQILDFKQSEKKLYIIVSHLDKIENYKENREKIFQSIENKLKTTIYKKGTQVIYGSLKGEQETKKVVEELISNIIDNKK